MTYADNSGYYFSYGASVQLTSVTDALGNIVEAHSYDAHGRALTSEKHGSLESYTLSYVNATETHVTDGLNRVTKYFFDKSMGRNMPTRVEGNCSCGGAQVQTWTYDNQLNVTSETDPLGHTISFTYDTNGNQLTRTDATGTITFTYNSLGKVLTRTDQMNGVWTNTYDSQGNLLSTTDPLNQTTTLTYDSRGQLLSVTDPRNNTTTFTYNENGNLTRRTDALTNQTNLVYDSRSRVTSVTNALNQITSFEYDLAGRLKKVIYPDSTFVLSTYDLAGRRVKIKDARGNETNFAYDNGYRLTSVTNAEGRVTSYSYNLMSRLTAITDALNRTADYSYDDLNRLTKIKYPEASAGAGRLEENFTYDLAGNLTAKIDQAGRTTNFAYDNANRLISATDAALKVTTFEYNARSQQTAVVDALGQRYEFVYDALGRVTQEKKGTATKSFLYDGAGNRTQRTDFNGAITNYMFDPLNRLTQINYPNSSSVTYGYDALSQVTSATNPGGTVALAYDNRGRVSSVTDVFGQVVGYSHDANGNRTQLTLGGVTSASYQYDVLNRLTQLTDSASQAFTFAYDATNKLTAQTAPNSVTTSYQYDGLDRLTGLTHATATTTVADFQYQLNPVNNITQLTDSGGVNNYSYDAVNRLTSATHPFIPSESFAYDAVGNRTNSHLSASYSYQPFNRLTSTSSATLGYDNNGNLTSKSDVSGTTVYGWDYENRLQQVTLPNGKIVSYKYDALGRRTERTEGVAVPVPLTTTTRFIYDGADIIRDTDGNGNTVTDYLNGPGIDNKLRQTTATASLYFVQDHLGSTRALTNAAGNLVATLSYDSFGNNGGSPLTRYTYTGREYDADTGLLYYGARFYDPQLGRFVSEDPISLAGGMNLYGYVENNPLGYVDPLGLCPQNDDLDEALSAARQILGGDNDCSRFFGGAGLNALNRIASALKAAGSGAFQPDRDRNVGIKGEVSKAVSPSNAPVTTTGIYAAVSPSSISINSNGAFVRTDGNLPRFGGYNPGTLQSRVLQLLHETGHLVVTSVTPAVVLIRTGKQNRPYQVSVLNYLLPPDAKNRALSERNTEAVLNACRELIDALGDRR